jgi:hypothetical protein
MCCPIPDGFRLSVIRQIRGRPGCSGPDRTARVTALTGCMTAWFSTGSGRPRRAAVPEPRAAGRWVRRLPSASPQRARSLWGQHHRVADVQVIAHRGSYGVHAEHTVQAFQATISEGSHALECDVRLTRDGVLVCVHDRRGTRTSNGRSRCPGVPAGAG